MFKINSSPVETASASSLVVMGVAGCGKSTVGEAIAQLLGWPLVEGDAFHSPANVQKMACGTALTDADRTDWLDRLAEVLQGSGPVVLTCSALKRSYRERLRESDAQVGFVFLDIDLATARQRVTQRAASHFFAASLVDSQFATLERPDGEARVWVTDASQDVPSVARAASAWWKAQAQAQRQSQPQVKRQHSEVIA